MLKLVVFTGIESELLVSHHLLHNLTPVYSADPTLALMARSQRQRKSEPRTIVVPSLGIYSARMQ